MTDQQIAVRMNELAGTTTALLAIIAHLPQMSPEIVKSARGLVGSLAPSPMPAPPGTPMPTHAALNALNKIESIVNSLTKVRAAGES